LVIVWSRWNGDRTIAIWARCREADLLRRRREVLTTGRTFKFEFHGIVDEIMAASFTIQQPKTILARSWSRRAAT